MAVRPVIRSPGDVAHPVDFFSADIRNQKFIDSIVVDD